MILRKVPGASVKGAMGRTRSFEVKLNDKLIYSKLEKSFFPDFDEVSLSLYLSFFQRSRRLFGWLLIDIVVNFYRLFWTDSWPSLSGDPREQAEEDGRGNCRQTNQEERGLQMYHLVVETWLPACHLSIKMNKRPRRRKKKEKKMVWSLRQSMADLLIRQMTIENWKRNYVRSGGGHFNTRDTSRSTRLNLFFFDSFSSKKKTFIWNKK